jgi:hypothetical protein
VRSTRSPPAYARPEAQEADAQLSTSVPFVLVDVFADTPLTGNPLAVVADAERLEEPVMRAAAREFNQSETTFVLPATRPGATWRLRSFTPAGAEVVGAGHNALGAWWWLASAGRIELDAEGGAVLAQEIGDRVLAQALLSATSRAGPRPVVEGLMGLGLTHSSPLARPASPGTERRVGKGRVAGGSVHAAEDGVRVERGGRAVDWRAWRGEPSKQGQCARRLNW